jgi:uncharacterized repeat protein (TIGR03803 family)
MKKEGAILMIRTFSVFFNCMGILVTAVLLAALALAADREHVIYSFAGDEDGEYADTDLILDGNGNVYGTTVQGGQFGSGTVFQLSRSNAVWTHNVLYNFTSGPDGGEPYKGVTLDSQGNLYGTAVIGGLHEGPCIDQGCGVVYELKNAGGVWTQTVIHKFRGGDDGYGPGAGVTIDAKGDIYGTTPTGGAQGLGVVYQLHRNAGGNWTERIIHTFTGGADGAGGSAGRLIFDEHGNIIGNCTAGGANGAGAVFELTPTQAGEWNMVPLYEFKGTPDSGFPYGGLLRTTDGDLYGTTYYDGANQLGTIYRLRRQNGVWSETALYSFKGGSDGSGPISNLVIAGDGNLYGTTSEGGAECSCGTIFRVSLGAEPGYSVVYRFTGLPDGAFAYNGMVAGPGGATLYGATVHGGALNEGAIYELIP